MLLTPLLNVFAVFLSAWWGTTRQKETQQIHSTHETLLDYATRIEPINLFFRLTTFVSYDTNGFMATTKTVNLRGLPEDVVRRAKACAALHGLTLRDFFIKAVEEAVEKDIPLLSASGTFFGGKRTKRVTKAKE